MDDFDDFEPRLGRQRAGGKGASARPVLHRILAATALARGGAWSARGKRFSGSKIGRGAGTGRVLASRDRFAAFRRRRVLVKARIVRLKGKGFEGAKAHLRYIQRDGVTREGQRGELYGADRDVADRDAFVERGQGDRHQFRFIVSPEDGAEYDDLKSLTRRLMAQVETDLRTRLDWVAVDHYNTGHPHTHIVVRGIDERGKDLVIAPDYIRHGMRERACELVDLDLGPRSDLAIADRLRGEVEQDRVTSIDRMLVRDTVDALVSLPAKDTFQQTIRMGRLRHLERLGLAEPEGRDWRLSPDMIETLRRMGERGDIIRSLQRAYTEREHPLPAAFDQAIFDPATAPAPLVGRVRARGLADEIDDRHYLIVEATDGRSHYVAIGKGMAVEALPGEAIVRVSPSRPTLWVADRTVAEVAAANDGRYSVDLHLAHDPVATEDYAQAHVRRLEAMRRALGDIERSRDGTWVVGEDHLARAAAYEERLVRDAPVRVEMLSRAPIEKLADIDAATWLDTELTDRHPTPLRNAGFGGECEQALARRRRWLLGQALATEADGVVTIRPDVVDVLRRRELLRVAGQLSEELELPFVQSRQGDLIEGVLRRPVDLASGRFALVEMSREFTLVPWRPVLERSIGMEISGLVRSRGIDWTMGRSRDLGIGM